MPILAKIMLPCPASDLLIVEGAIPGSVAVERGAYVVESIFDLELIFDLDLIFDLELSADKSRSELITNVVGLA